MINFVRVVIPKVRQCFIKSEHRFHLCPTLKQLNKPQIKDNLDTPRIPEEFSIVEVGRVHAQSFQSLRPSIVKDIKTLDRTLLAPPIIDELVELIEQENLLFWYDLRPLSIIGACEELAKSRGHTLADEELFDIYRLAWTYKLFELHTFMLDEISDDHAFRNGQPTWWSRNNKNPVGTQYAFGLRNLSRILMHQYFKDKFYYQDIRTVKIQTITLYTWGEHLTSLTETEEFLKKITPEAYLYLTAFKIAYNFYLPVYYGLHMNGVYDKDDAEKVYKACRIAGGDFKCWDDFLDCETDLTNGRCTWLTVLAFDKANDSQKKILLDNYCKTDQKSILATLKVYEEMDMKTIVFEQRKKMKQAIENELQTIKNPAVRKIIINITSNLEDLHCL